MTSLLPSTPMGADSDSDSESESDDGPFLRTLKFSFRHSPALVAISLVWTLLAVPIVTVGPATLGAYRAIISLRETGRVDAARVRLTVAEHVVPATLLGLGPPAFCGIGLLYAAAPPQWIGSRLVSSGIGVLAVYAGLYLAIVLVPTFHQLARGHPPVEAVRTGYATIAGDPVTAVRIAVVTTLLFCSAALLTVSLVVFFPAFTAAYHVHLADALLTDSRPEMTNRK